MSEERPPVTGAEGAAQDKVDYNQDEVDYDSESSFPASDPPPPPSSLGGDEDEDEGT